jgi:hypothetical protein
LEQKKPNAVPFQVSTSKLKTSMKTLLTLTVLAGTLGVAHAQYPGTPSAPPLNYLQNYYNRQQQPLSPYLNLLRGQNPGVNYYYGVRPGTPAGGANVFGQAPMYNPFVGLSAGGFLPQSSQPNDGNAVPYDVGGQPVVLRSAGHNVLYGNIFLGHGSYLSVNAQGVGRSVLPGGQQMAVPRASTQGLGTAPPRR